MAAHYHGYCPKCKNSGPVWLETLINHPPVYCNQCNGLMEVSSQALAIIQNTPQATVQRVDPPVDDLNRNGTRVYLSQGRREFSQRMLERAFPDGIVGMEFV